LTHGKWRAVITDHKGRRKTYTFGTNRQLAQKQADLLEAREREIKNGIRPVPVETDTRPIWSVVEECLEWGAAQGGKRGMPWIPTHCATKRRHLLEWKEALKLEHLTDLYGILPKVEAYTRVLMAGGKSGKSVSIRVESLRSFILWCKKWKFLTENPIEEIAKFDTTPVNIRRAMTKEEIKLLLEGCAPHRRLLYEVAACSELRENELRQLTPRHLDRDNCAIVIERKWDKGRKDRLQYIPQELMRRLIEFVDSGQVTALYEKAIQQQGRRAKLKGRAVKRAPVRTAQQCGTIESGFEGCRDSG
ncbi:MAG: tyrosine-type recombinase/integrase, partial [Planctomycetaceae bacterium]|nr:tyrosine-type recombinase/integrase [Planctomycetaceae bacterium]